MGFTIDKRKLFSVWMVEVWEDGRWSEYWPVDAPGTSRSAAVKRGRRVLCGEWRRKRWRVGRLLRTYQVV